jgi:hypothetical protein
VVHGLKGSQMVKYEEGMVGKVSQEPVHLFLPR